jgi:hypothetical protein
MVAVFRHFGGGAQRLEHPRLNLQQAKKIPERSWLMPP